MNERNDEKLRKILQSAIPPLEDPELKRDLWPQMLRRLEERTIRVSWLDWALVALVIVCLLVFPEVIPGVLYQL